MSAENSSRLSSTKGGEIHVTPGYLSCKGIDSCTSSVQEESFRQSVLHKCSVQCPCYKIRYCSNGTLNIEYNYRGGTCTRAASQLAPSLGGAFILTPCAHPLHSLPNPVSGCLGRACACACIGIDCLSRDGTAQQRSLLAIRLLIVRCFPA